MQLQASEWEGVWTSPDGFDLVAASDLGVALPSSFLFNYEKCFMCVGILPTYLTVHYMCMVLAKSRRQCWILGFGAMDSCEQPCACWELNLIL